MNLTHETQNTNKVKVPERFAGSRADIVFSEILSGFSRAQVIKFIRSGNILVDGSDIKPSKILSGGESVTFDLPDIEVSEEPDPQNIKLNIIFEDEDIIVVDKPAGMVVHPGSGINKGTLVNGLIFRYPELADVGDRQRPGIVHRLDKETSGVMVVARNNNSFKSLVEQFKKREVDKEYLAIIYGSPDTESGIFSSSIGRHSTNRIKMSSRTNSPRKAKTYWTVISRYGDFTLVKAEPKTGRTHQIRVHFSEAGLPIISDKVYGGKNTPRAVHGYKLERHALHAHKLGFIHPVKKQKVEFCSPLPGDLDNVLKLLGGENSST